MIFNKEVLFLHPVKTGGTSLTNFLLSRLKSPVFYVSQKGHHGKYNQWDEIISLIGNRHGNLPYARDFLKQFVNYSIEKFKIIISGIRNPYAIELSRFYFFARDIEWIKPDAREVILARRGDFETFAREAPYNYCRESDLPEIQHYYTIDGAIPANMTMLRCENLKDDFKYAFNKNKIRFNRFRGFKNIPKRDVYKRPWGVVKDALSILGIHDTYHLPRLNVSRKDKTLDELLTPAAERAIYNKYKWVFDQGLYKRITHLA